MAEIQDFRKTDLFGNPVRTRKGQRGRPSLEISAEDRDVVEAALVRGWSNERIAKAVGISVPSLKRHFRSALAKRDAARDRMEAALFSALARQGIDKGNVGALRQLRELLDKDMARAQQAEMHRRQSEADSAGVKLGKKEAAQQAAEAALQSEGWGDLLKPGGMH
ncbi:sigma-70 family RNA polymerase sigma factor [Roseinatronobacter bogoriensis]|uniref:sigma-70 family RNA polymerase sigma factor n=1 Tax=Roseinatronobacter bogoriensis TaxID=119542 RepID=UPI00106576C2|nr:sigma-70 family RNA polymerase sigma factor [Rhodobaca bogoriensis]MBB4207272.1 DNA-binding CsgD family transcriptional regulator [Rhodobaca bogoriensis DSM 18756]TDY65771.1 hypothetical protein EV660_11739 [Rhodobaca bogoriensis DSM 18756]